MSLNVSSVIDTSFKLKKKSFLMNLFSTNLLSMNFLWIYSISVKYDISLIATLKKVFWRLIENVKLVANLSGIVQKKNRVALYLLQILKFVRRNFWNYLLQYSDTTVRYNLFANNVVPNLRYLRPESNPYNFNNAN